MFVVINDKPHADILSIHNTYSEAYAAMRAYHELNLYVRGFCGTCLMTMDTQTVSHFCDPDYEGKGLRFTYYEHKPACYDCQKGIPHGECTPQR